MTISFYVFGVPKPAGSKRVFINKKNGKPIVTDAAGQGGKDWRGDVKHEAAKAHSGALLIGPLSLTVDFYMPRPLSHYRINGQGKVLRADAPQWCDRQPDATKLLRCVEDALTSVLWNDDAQIVSQTVFKRYVRDGDRPGALIMVSEGAP